MSSFWWKHISYVYVFVPFNVTTKCWNKEGTGKEEGRGSEGKLRRETGRVEKGGRGRKGRMNHFPTKSIRSLRLGEPFAAFSAFSAAVKKTRETDVCGNWLFRETDICENWFYRETDCREIWLFEETDQLWKLTSRESDFEETNFCET